MRIKYKLESRFGWATHFLSAGPWENFWHRGSFYYQPMKFLRAWLKR